MGLWRYPGFNFFVPHVAWPACRCAHAGYLLRRVRGWELGAPCHQRRLVCAAAGLDGASDSVGNSYLSERARTWLLCHTMMVGNLSRHRGVEVVGRSAAILLSPFLLENPNTTTIATSTISPMNAKLVSGLFPPRSAIAASVYCGCALNRQREHARQVPGCAMLARPVRSPDARCYSIRSPRRRGRAATAGT